MQAIRKGRHVAKRSALATSSLKARKKDRKEVAKLTPRRRLKPAEGEVPRRQQHKRVFGHSKEIPVHQKYRKTRFIDGHSFHWVNKPAEAIRLPHQPLPTEAIREEVSWWDAPEVGDLAEVCAECMTKSPQASTLATVNSEGSQQTVSRSRSGPEKTVKGPVAETSPPSLMYVHGERRPLSPLSANQALERTQSKVTPTFTDIAPRAIPVAPSEGDDSGPRNNMRRLGSVKSLRLRSGSVVTLITPENNAWQRSTYIPGPIKLEDEPIPQRKDSVANLDAFQDAIEGLQETSQPRRASDDAVIDGIVDYFSGFGVDFNPLAGNEGTSEANDQLRHQLSSLIP